MAALDPQLAAILEANLNQLKRLREGKGVKGIRKVVKAARGDILKSLSAIGAADVPTASNLRTLLGQLEIILDATGSEMSSHLKDASKSASELGAKHGLNEFRAFSKHFTGMIPVIDIDVPAVLAGLIKDVESSLLRRHSIQSRTWSLNALRQIEETLSVGAMAKKPMGQITKEITAKTGLLAQEEWRAERIVRTEMAYAHGAAKHESMTRTRDEVEPRLHKCLLETFDNRTGDDSFLLHGQMVPVDKPFSWKHKRGGQWVVTEFMHPPNRPNDRSVAIPWDPEWKLTKTEKPLNRAELAAAGPTKWRKKVGVKIPPGHKPGKPYR